MKPGMIKVSVMYPAGEGNTFDMNYYTQKHIPMVASLLGDAVKGATIDKGLSGPEPGSAPAYSICGHLYFESLDAFQNAFGPNAEKIMGDIPNFTNVQPVVQIGEVLV
jgi:uncharacterized protein (TIGR02118 family)